MFNYLDFTCVFIIIFIIIIIIVISLLIIIVIVAIVIIIIIIYFNFHYFIYIFISAVFYCIWYLISSSLNYFLSSKKHFSETWSFNVADHLQIVF